MTTQKDEARWTINDLKSFAAARCLDIFSAYDESEIGSESKSVQKAWDIGRQIQAIYANH